MRGNYEFGDFTLDQAGLSVKQGEHILGDDVYRYLRRYAENFDIYRVIRFNTRVETAEHLAEAGWLLSTVSKETGEPTVIRTSKLIIATGLTSDAFTPTFPGRGQYSAPIVHVKDLQARSPQLFSSVSRATVLGGTKSAWDASYAFAAAGIPVDWVIRESGHGPVWMSPAKFSKKRNLLLERLVHLRLVTLFSPCVWGPSDGFGWIRQLLHNTRIGRWTVDRYWQYMQRRLVRTNGYGEHPEVGKLKPWVDIFWIAGSLSILNYRTDFFEFVRSGMIKVHIADVAQLTDHTVRLSTGAELASDALICSTGWRHRPAIQFLPEGIDALLGIPHRGPHANPELVAKADQELLRRFPRLRRQPTLNPHYKPMEGVRPSEALDEPYRLYRFMVPPALFPRRDVAFAGIVQSISTVYIAQAQALWMTAYFDGHTPKSLAARFPQDDKGLAEQLVWDTLLQTQYGKWRCPGGYGSRFPDFVYDGLPYIDQLLNDLGLKSRRKGNIFRELLEPYLTSDYANLVNEWRVMNKLT